MIHEKTRELVLRPDGKDGKPVPRIVLLVCDGLGGLPDPKTGKTELEMARIPNLDRLATVSSGGRMLSIEHGVTPGSGPAHLALFGYAPFEVEFGRGALEAMGSDFDMLAGDLAARANFATLRRPASPTGVVEDRRAGRPADAENRRLCEKLVKAIGPRVEGCELFILPGKEHRFTVVFRGGQLSPSLNDNDPQREGRPLLEILPGVREAERSAHVVNTFLEQGLEALADEPKANGMLLRGFSNLPQVMPFDERYGVRSAAIAAYPMYRGVARLVGMEVLGPPRNFDEELALLERHFQDYDFFFVHFKATDTAGHSGDFAKKVEALQAVDATIPRIEALKPEVLIVTGDHSTPCAYLEHSWHPVPTTIRSPWALPGVQPRFSERGLMAGDLGVFPATDLLPLALAHAGRLSKFGA
jgi:2,3-bisphosphoglycerate-independent phosphoglycerate mutase